MAKTVTPVFRVSYPHLFKPQLNKLSNKEEYSLLALFPKNADLTKLRTLAKEAAEEKWGADQKKWPKKFRSPFRNHDEKLIENDDGSKSYPPGYEQGGVFLTMKSKERPGVVDAQVQPILDPTEFYAGCYAVASVNVYAYDQAGNAGVAFGLGNVQKVKDGESLGGTRSKPENDFSPIALTNGEDPSTAVNGEGKDAASLFS